MSNITPPPELVRQWLLEYYGSDLGELSPEEMYVARCAAEWGADQELEACSQALYDRYDSVRHATGFPGSDMSDWLRDARRPKPPSLKEQALEMLEITRKGGHIGSNSAGTIRRALEALPE